MRTATIRRLATSFAAAIGDASRSDTAVTAESTPTSGGDPPCAYAMIDAKANEEAPYFTNRRRDSFWSAAIGLPQLRDRCQALANDIGYRVQARRITGFIGCWIE